MIYRIAIPFLAVFQVHWTTAGAQQDPDLCASAPIPMIYIPAGPTTIMSPRPDDPAQQLSSVTVEVDGFCISRDEIPARLYGLCIDEGACEPSFGPQDGPDYPVHSITYEDTQTFVAWLSEEHDREYRLPSEAEWQRAALGGLADRYPWRVVGRLPRLNIFSDAIWPIGQSSENEFGVRDAIGNVAEFVDGCFTSDEARFESGGGAVEVDDCHFRLTKGGHYSVPAFALSPFFRSQVPAAFASRSIGFRIAHTAD